MNVERTIVVLITGGQLLLASGQTFNRRYDPFGQSYAQVAWSIDPSGADGYAITVATYYDDSVYLYITAALIRIDADGEVLSESKMLHGMSSVYPGWANCSERVNDGGIAIGGSILLPSDSNNAAIIRYTADGDSLWLREYSHGIGRQVKQTKDGGYILCGERVVGNHTDAFLIKTDSQGNEEWDRSYGGPNSDYGISVDTTSDDGYFVGGQYKVTQNNKNFWVFRVDVDGDTLWSKQWGGPLNEPNAHLTTLANGNPIIASATDFINDYAGRMYMAELDQNDGHIIWERRYGPGFAFTSLFASKEVQPGEGTIAAGYFEPPDSIGLLKGVLLRCAPNGDSLWLRSYVYADSLLNDGVGYFEDVIPTLDGGFIACGATTGSYSGNDPPGYEQDAWVVKVDSMGCIVPGCDDFNVAITEQVTNLKQAISVYPNPAATSTTVKVTLPLGTPYARNLNLRVVSAHGQEVLVQGAVVGDNTVYVGALPSGLYYVHLTSGSTWLSGARLVVE